jgi:hypothetical protein
MPPPSAQNRRAGPPATAPVRPVLPAAGTVAPEPAPAVKPGEVEDESADPVGDGRSDAELARRMGHTPTTSPAGPPPATDAKQHPETDEKKGRSSAP